MVDNRLVPESLSIEEDDGARIPIGSGLLVEVQFLNERPRRLLLERLGVEIDCYVVAVVPGSGR
jgi:hypothetical protein